MNPTRRQFLTGSAIIAAGGLSTLGLPAFADAETTAKAVADFVGDSETQTEILYQSPLALRAT
jgi:nitrous oxide reductase